MHFYTIDTPEERFKQVALNGGKIRIFASGPIEIGTTAAFEKFVEDKGIEWGEVYFDSPGGVLFEGLSLGRAIRLRGFDTHVGVETISYPEPPTAICASAAAYAFAGGVSRFYSEFGGQLGVHQFSRGEDNFGDLGEAQIISAQLVSYLREMGVDPSAFVRASEADANDMAWLTPEEASALSLANNGVAPTTSKVRMVGGETYLRLEQVHHDVTARVLIGSESGRLFIFGGIVTTPERSAELISHSSRSYLEFDWETSLGIQGIDQAEAEDHVVWIVRELSSDTMELLRSCTTIGMWLDNDGPMRWGATLNLADVRDDINHYLNNFRSVTLA